MTPTRDQLISMGLDPDELDEIESLRSRLAAALAECERLRTVVTNMDTELDLHIAEITRLSVGNAQFNHERDAWRACADRLAVDLERHLEADDSEALDLYESLKGALS